MEYLISILNAQLLSSCSISKTRLSNAAAYADAYTYVAAYANNDASAYAAASAYAKAINEPSAYAVDIYASAESAADAYAAAYASSEAYVTYASAHEHAARFWIYPDLRMAQEEKLGIDSPLLESNLDKLINDFILTIESIDPRLEFYTPFVKRRLYGEAFTDPDLKLIEAILSISKEKYEQGSELVFQFIKDHYYGRLSEKVNLARVIFIGPGEVGKTSLIKALNNQEVVAGEEPTPGIETSRWTWGEGCNMDIHFWDFAGQVTTHAMHKFFLRERCLYVLLLTNRDDQELETQAEYWLEHVRLYGNDSPVIVVANKIDNRIPINFNQKDLKEKYPFILDFKEISAAKANDATEIRGVSYKNRFDNFRDFFIASIQDVVNQYKNELSIAENEVKKVLLKLDTQHFIDDAGFKKLCSEKGVEAQRMESLKMFFNNLGILVHFPKFNDDALLNPKWLSYGVYQVLRQAEAAKRKGWLRESDIVEHLKKGVKLDDGTVLDYSVSKINTLIIKCILEFKLGYSIKRKGANYLVLPSVLGKEECKHSFQKEGSMLRFSYDFEVLLPPYILHAFVSKSSEEILNDWAWQSGVVLQEKLEKVQALICKSTSRKIDIYVHAENEILRKKACGYLDELRLRFQEIIQGEEGSEQPRYKELMEIPESYFVPETIDLTVSNRLISYKTLQKAREFNYEKQLTDYGEFYVKRFFGDHPMKKEKKANPVSKTYHIAGDMYEVGRDQFVAKGKQYNAKGNISITKRDVVEELIPLIQQFVDAVSINKEARKEIADIKEFLDELINYPEEVEMAEVESIKEKFGDKTFIEKLGTLASIPAAYITISEKLAPLLETLLKSLPGT